MDASDMILCCFIFIGVSSVGSELSSKSYLRDKEPVVPTRTLKDDMGIQEKTKLIDMSRELIGESISMIHQIEGVRNDHAHFIPFEVGAVIGTIREKYRRMMALYSEIEHYYSGRTNLYSRHIYSELRPLHYLAVYEWIRHMEVDIERLIEVLENIPDEDLKLQIMGGQTKQKTKDDAMEDTNNGTDVGSKSPGKPVPEQEKIARTGIDGDTYNHERYKSRMREVHLLKKLGLPANVSTTKKRFHQDWPVDETWDLNQYGELAGDRA